MKNSIKNYQKILKYLPHRYPFLLVDKIVDLNLTSNSIISLKNVTSNEAYFNGHFPDMPVMPGVLILEALAQSCGILGYEISLVKQTQDETKLYLFAGIDKVKFKKMVLPGDQLFLHGKLLKWRSNISKFYAEAQVDNAVVCSAELTCAYKRINE